MINTNVYVVTCHGVTVEWTPNKAEAEKRFSKCDGQATFTQLVGNKHVLIDSKAPKKFRAIY